MKTIKNNLILFLLLFFVILANAQSIGVTIANSEPMQVCNGTTTKLQVRADFVTAGQGAIASLVLPNGITYVAGSIKRIGTSKPKELKIIEKDIKDPSKPIFSIIGKIEKTDWIEFTIDKTANCTAFAESEKGKTFTDQVTVKLGDSQKTQTSNSYLLNTPKFIVKGSIQNDIEPFKTYARVFSVTNSGISFANRIYLDVAYNKEIKSEGKALRLGNKNGVKVTPSYITDNVYHYIIDGKLLGADQKFTNGEKLIFYEEYSVTGCDTQTKYTVSWGCSKDSFCQSVSTEGVVNIVVGEPKSESIVFSEWKSNYKNACTPFHWSVTFTNNGTNNLAGAMYDVIFRLGGQNDENLSPYDWRLQNVIQASIGGIAIPGFTKMDKIDILTLDLANKITKDQVKGKNIGLRDLDGDGFVDDIAAGDSVTIDFLIQVNCSFFICNNINSVFCVYGVKGDIQFTNICKEKKNSIKLNGYTDNDIGIWQIANLEKSIYAPQNIYEGKVFQARFGFSCYNFKNPHDTKNTRYYYKIELPSGLSIDKNSIRWYNSTYPNNLSNPIIPKISKNGNTLTITSTNENIGYFIANFTYKKVSSTNQKLKIPFTFSRIDDITSDCTTCIRDIMCDSMEIENIVYQNNSCSIAITTTFAKVERADNSLGYTDTNMTKVQNRANISAYDLSKALYLDDIEVTAKAKQNQTARDLYVKFSIAKLGNSLEKERFQAKGLNYKIIRAGKILTHGTLNTANLKMENNEKEQVFRWNLTSVLPNRQIQAGDEIETVATYQVISNDMPHYDVQTGKEIYFYNTDSADEEMFCNKMIPEMYLVSPYFINANNGGNSLFFKSCDLKNIGEGTDYFAYRFNTQGIKYLSEKRPGFLPKTYSFTLPENLTLKQVLYNNVGDITSKLMKKGNTYTYIFEEKYYDIEIENNYSGIFGVFAYPSCGTATENTNYHSELTYYPYWYHYKRNGITPEPVTHVKNIELFYDENTRPKVELKLLSSIITNEKPVQNTEFRLASTGITTAPYTWIAIPNQKINVLSLKDSKGNSITPISYSNGSLWYRLSEAGLASGTFQDFTLSFTHNFCQNTDIKVLAGWNCTDFPENPDKYSCGGEELLIPYRILPTEIELFSVKEPPKEGYDLCTTQQFQYELNNKEQGSVKDVSLQLTLPKGMTLVAGSFEAEYPKNSGKWESIPPVMAGKKLVLNLANHSNFPKEGIPGVYLATDNNQRIVGLRWKTETNCDFVSGSTIIIEPSAKTKCGKSVKVSNKQLETQPNLIKGAIYNYQILNKIEATDVNNCKILTLKCNSVLSGVTKTEAAWIRITAPIGFTYHSFKATGGSHKNGLTYDNTEVDPDTGQNIVRLNLLAGMEAGNSVEYELVFIPDPNMSCGDKIFVMETRELVPYLSCDKVPGGLCKNVQAITGKSLENANFRLPILSITELSGTSLGKIEASITISNTGANQNEPSIVNFYCADKNGKPTGNVLHSFKMPSAIKKGEKLSANIEFSPLPACTDLVAVISQKGACICSEISKVFTPSKCKFEVKCPTFKEEKVDCYGKIPTKTTYTKAEFEKLGDGKGKIGNYICGAIDISAQNIGAKVSCKNNKVTRVYTIIEYEDLNKNNVYDKDKDKILHSQKCTQNFIVNDNVKPKFVGQLPKNETYKCTQKVPKEITLTATDNCDPNVKVIFKEVPIEENKNCTGYYKKRRIWTATDICGNQVKHEQIISVEPDITISKLPKDTIYYKCIKEVLPADDMKFIDNCNYTEKPVKANKDEITDDLINHVRTIKRRWKATHSCGMEIDYTQTIIVKDLEAPKLPTYLPKKEIQVECSMDLPTKINLIFTDACDGNITVQSKDKSVKGKSPGEYIIERTWTATDKLGNSASYTQFITIKNGNSPTFVEKALPAKMLTVCPSAIPKMAKLTAKDGCGAFIDVVPNEDIPKIKDCKAGYTIVRTWTAKAANKREVTHQQIITVKDDIAPTFIGDLPEKEIKFTCASKVPIAQDVKFIDNCDKTEKIAKVNDQATPGDCPNNFTIERTWTAEDFCGNQTSYTQTITVKDEEKPMFVSDLPEEELFFTCASEVPKAEVLKFIDNCDPNEKEVKAKDKKIPGDCPNNFTIERTWTAIDACGNKESYTQTIIVKDDIAPEFVEELPAEELQFTCVSEVPEPEILTATDNCDTIKVKFNQETIPGDCPSNFTLIRTWTAKDSCNNQTKHTQTIVVKDDIAPEFIDEIPENAIYACASDVPEMNLSIQAKDNCGSAYVTVKQIKTPGECPKCYTLTRIWTAQDDCGNFKVATQTIIVKDDQAPTFVEDLPQDLEVACHEIPAHQILTAIDNCDDNVEVTFEEVRREEVCNHTYLLERIWVATDSAENKNVHIQTIKVKDEIAPIITNPAGDIVVECDGIGNQTELANWLNNHAGATATDNCGQVSWTNDFVKLTPSQGNLGTATVTFTATDECNNSTTTQATFTIIDTTAPTIAKANDKIVECDSNGNIQEYNQWLSNNGGAIAIDPCSDVSWTHQVENTENTCVTNGKTSVRFTATDTFGNVSWVVQNFVIEDTTPPVITDAKDLKVECDGQGNQTELQNWLDSNGGATATDVCSSENLIWSNNFTALQDGCLQDSEVTFTVTDNCGNQSNTKATFSIIDTTPPDFVGDLPKDGITIAHKDLKEAPVLKAVDICGDAIVTITQEKQEEKCEVKSDLTRVWTASDDCGNEKTYTQNIHLVSEPESFNNVSPNGDGVNEVFYIKGMDCYPENIVQIFNRWGVRVYSKKGYNNIDKFWDGKDLPQGTYFYVIEYTGEENKPVKQSGFIHLSK